jgi:vacuolar-type H+-ATPase subunit E/Vma4
MKIVEEKIDKFTHDIMTDVSNQRNKIMEETEKELKLMYEKKELEYLSKAYKIIQNGLKNIEKEKNEIISRSIMDSKRKILKERNNIINSIFENAETELVEFTQTKDYINYLVKMIKEGIDNIGDGDIIIYISYTDKNHLDILNSKFSNRIVLEDKHTKMIGGCKIHNKSSNLFLDDSFSTKLYNEKETFLTKCKLEIE